jgi:hypothetical protein
LFFDLLLSLDLVYVMNCSEMTLDEKIVIHFLEVHTNRSLQLLIKYFFAEPSAEGLIGNLVKLNAKIIVWL